MPEAPSVRLAPKKEPRPKDGMANVPEANASIVKACMMIVEDLANALTQLQGTVE